ncbi:MAG TPA: polysaccharide biosynthesis/export family protein [Polyangiaceae bacterium]|nr:polysaccharide biosynthesis/export family protein [Polyangiaceae bacterium]
MRACLSSLLLVCALGCGSKPPPVVAKRLQSPVVARQSEQLDPALLDDTIGGVEGDAYRVGAGDTVLVAVYGHPEFSIAPYAGTTLASANGRLAGLVIDNDGTIQFPLVGSVNVAGRTSAELKAYLEKELGVYVKDPKVTVQVIFTASIRYYLLGQFTQPGLKYSDRPVRLLEGLSLGGSVMLDRASLSTAYVARGKRRLPIDFRRLVLEGDLQQNIKLRSGDVILIPDKTSEQAFVFGGAAGGHSKGTVVPFANGRLNLLQALAAAGFGYRDHAQGRLSETRVIRSAGARGELFTIDAARMLAGDVGPFELSPGDVVYVPASTITNWNEALAQLLPSLQTVSGLLTPFVQIKYLSE